MARMRKDIPCRCPPFTTPAAPCGAQPPCGRLRLRLRVSRRLSFRTLGCPGFPASRHPPARVESAGRDRGSAIRRGRQHRPTMRDPRTRHHPPEQFRQPRVGDLWRRPINEGMMGVMPRHGGADGIEIGRWLGHWKLSDMKGQQRITRPFRSCGHAMNFSAPPAARGSAHFQSGAAAGFSRMRDLDIRLGHGDQVGQAINAALGVGYC